MTDWTGGPDPEHERELDAEFIEEPESAPPGSLPA